MTGYRRGLLLIPLVVMALVASAYPQGIPELVAQARTSVAFVLASGDEPSSGTAFVIHRDGILVTALHVVDEAREISVVLPGGEPRRADLLLYDSENDAALIRIPLSGLAPLRFGDSSAITVGEEIVVIGYPLATALGNYDVTVTRGIVNAVRSQLRLIQIDASLNPGASGGPVLNGRGEVIGMAVGQLPGGQNVNFAGPIDAAKTLLSTYLDRAGTLSPLALPLVSNRPMALSFKSPGIGAGGHKEELGLACLQPPQHTKEIAGVQAELDNTSGLVVVTWLSLGEGRAFRSPGTFGYMLSAQARKISASGKGYLRPETVCLNYRARNPSLLPVGLTFTVKYTLEYKVRATASP